jgi:cyclophilin family peptidyl-prolyl cis-trans isomerase
MLDLKGMTPNKNSRVPKRKSRKNLWLAIGIVAIVIMIVGAYAVIGNSNQAPNSTATPTPTPTSTSSASPSPTSSSTKVLLHTTVGDITIELRNDKPITTSNFVNIVKKGYYDNTIFHRVIAGFMIQGGGISQSVSSIADEIGNNNRNTAYTIAMAKTSQPNSATSQFFINVADNGNNAVDAQGTKFDSVYTQFGTVISGRNVVDAIATAQVTTNQYGENSQPVNPVSIISATIIS